MCSYCATKKQVNTKIISGTLFVLGKKPNQMQDKLTLEVGGGGGGGY